MKRFITNKQTKFLLTSGGLFAVLTLTGLMLATPRTHAEGAVDKVSVKVPLSCTMMGTVDTAHTRNITAGQYEQNIGQTTLTAYCNDTQGFEIYAKGISSETSGQETDLISSLGSTYNIHTGTATNGATSSWGMKVTAVSGTYTPNIDTTGVGTVNGDGYFAVPGEYTRVAYRTTATDGTAGTGSSVRTTYYVYTAGTQPAGTYTGKVSYAMFHPYTDAGTVTLKKAFFLAEKETVTVDGEEYYKMQDMSPEICAAATVTGEASQVQLVDIRDNKIYWVTKLADNQCWMTQNLDLDLSTSTALTSENTDLNEIGSNGYTTDNGYAQNGSVISWTPLRSTIDATGVTMGNTITGWTNDYYTPYSVNVGELYTDGTWYDSDNDCDYDSQYNCTNHLSSTPYSTNGTHGAVGNYYNWSAAVAANTTNVTAWKSSTYSNISNNPQNSICPAGWRLPTVSSTAANNEFKQLNTLYNSGSDSTDVGLFNAPLYLPRAGYVYSSRQKYTAYGGDFWSSTVDSSAFAYYLYSYSSYVYPEDTNYRNVGFSVRCVAR